MNCFTRIDFVYFLFMKFSFLDYDSVGPPVVKSLQVRWVINTHGCSNSKDE